MEEPIKIGLMFSTTGKQSWAGLECVEAAENAVALAEKDGLIRPGQVKLLKGDVHSPETAASEAKRLIKEGANVLHGTIKSDWVPPAVEVAEENGVLYWEAVSASEEIHRNNFRNFFRISVTCRPYGEGIVSFIGEVLSPAWKRSIDSLRIATVRQQDSFCDSLIECFTSKARELKMDIVAEEVVEQNELDFGPLVRKLAAANTDVLMAATYSGPAPNLWLEATKQNLAAKAFFGTGAWALGQNVSSLGVLRNGLYAVGAPHVVAIDTSKLDKKAQRYLERWRSDMNMHHTDRNSVDRDLVMVALRVFFEDVLPKASSLDLDDLRASILDVDIPIGGTFIGYGVKMREDGDNLRAFPAIMQWQNECLETVYPNVISTNGPDIR